jgi:hypothetical protein
MISKSENYLREFYGKNTCDKTHKALEHSMKDMVIHGTGSVLIGNHKTQHIPQSEQRLISKSECNDWLVKHDRTHPRPRCRGTELDVSKELLRDYAAFAVSRGRINLPDGSYMVDWWYFNGDMETVTLRLRKV